MCDEYQNDAPETSTEEQPLVNNQLITHNQFGKTFTQMVTRDKRGRFAAKSGLVTIKQPEEAVAVA